MTGYTEAFLKKMFIGLRFKVDHNSTSNLVYFYSDTQNFEERDLEFVAITGGVLHIINKEWNVDVETHEITERWPEHHFIPIETITGINVNDPAPEIVEAWKKRMEAD